MTEPESTGYQDSPDTTDPARRHGGGRPGGRAALTTDDDAQHDDGVMRPGNEPD